MTGGSRFNHFPESKQPLISIIIVTYNAAGVLKPCLESIIAQSIKAIEIIIADGGSNDGTIDLLKEYDSFITKWVSEPDKGIYDAMNKAVKMTSGKWLYFMGADDRLLPGFSEMAAELTNSDTLYYGDTQTDREIFKGEFSKYRLAKYCINHQTIFYPRTVFEKYSYNLKYTVLADYALNIQCWGDDAIKKKYIPVNVAYYNTEGISSVADDKVFKQDKPQIIRKSMGWLMYLRFLYKRRKEQRRPGSNFY